jgi:hypothetical protein
LPGCAPGPGELEKGAQAPGAVGISRRWPHELTTEGVRAKRIGNMPASRKPLQGRAVGRHLCGASRSGPVPVKGAARADPRPMQRRPRKRTPAHVEARLAWPRKEAHVTWRDRRGSRGREPRKATSSRDAGSTASTRVSGDLGLCSRIVEVGRQRRRRAAMHRESERRRARRRWKALWTGEERRP